MIQCFVRNKFNSVISSYCNPRFRSISKREPTSCKMPRAMHSHDDILEILYISSGTGVYIVDDKRYQVEKGDIIICNSNITHDEFPSEFNHKVSSFGCAISDIQLPGLQKNCLISNEVRPVFHTGRHSDDINNLMCMLFSNLSSNEFEADETCQHLMMALLTIVMNIISKNPQTENEDKNNQQVIYEQIKEYIDSHYNEDIKLNGIAKAMNLSPYYLSHVFKNVTGYSPMQYILRRRIGESQTLLIDSEYSITEIASIVGYDNPNYFNIIFTKKIGMSPSQYRKTYT